MRLPRQLENLARVLTYMLCHRPDEFGLVLSEEGFIPVKQVLQALSAEPGFAYVRRHHLEEVAGLLGPESFEIAGDAIRGLKPGPARLRGTLGDKPPPLLYAAIPPKVHPRVWEEGLKAPAGQELLLARQPEFALKLGRRRAPKPILVTVQAQAAAKQGITFQGYGEDLFLTPAVPRAFLQLTAPPAAPVPAKPVRPPAPVAAPGAILLNLTELFQESTPPRLPSRKRVHKDKDKEKARRQKLPKKGR